MCITCVLAAHQRPDLLELELQVVVSHCEGMQPESSVRATRAPIHVAISAGQNADTCSLIRSDCTYQH